MDTKIATDKLYDLLVLGGGPAGLNAAMYASRKGLDVIVLSMSKGGQLNDTAMVENYLGMNSILGYELAERFVEHLNKYKVPVVETSKVVEYRRDNIDHEVTLSTGEIYRGKAVVIATGSVYRALHVPREFDYVGRGVSYCAICDAPLFRNKNVFVVGGGNAAVEAALDLSKYAKTVTILHRSEFRADKVLLDQIESDPKIAYHLKTNILEILGDDVVKGVLTKNLDTGEEKIFNGDGVFIEIGQVPNTGPFKDILHMNAQGAIITDSFMATNIPGVFAAGNVREFPYQQIIIAASDGAIAALSASDYLCQKYHK